MSRPQIASEYLEKIHQEHQHQGQQLARLRKALVERLDLNALAKLLVEMSGELAEHFRLEEDGGYFDDAVAVAPRLIEQANRLRHQHGELRERLDSLLQTVESTQATDGSADEIRHSTREFIFELVEHERSENLMVTEAYQQDIGEGD